MSDSVNPMLTPRITKVTVNIGVGEGGSRLQLAEQVLKLLTDSTPVRTISSSTNRDLGTREGAPIGCKVTLRNEKMYDFFENLIKISLPRTRDFRGLNPKSFDGRGNYTLGVKEHIIFPEINFDRIDKIKGLDITITTNAKNNQEAMELFKQFNFPFK